MAGRAPSGGPEISEGELQGQSGLLHILRRRVERPGLVGGQAGPGGGSGAGEVGAEEVGEVGAEDGGGTVEMGRVGEGGPGVARVAGVDDAEVRVAVEPQAGESGGDEAVQAALGL